jgi:hypothetical protein
MADDDAITRVGYYSLTELKLTVRRDGVEREYHFTLKPDLAADERFTADFGDSPLAEEILRHVAAAFELEIDPVPIKLQASSGSR